MKRAGAVVLTITVIVCAYVAIRSGDEPRAESSAALSEGAKVPKQRKLGVLSKIQIPSIASRRATAPFGRRELAPIFEPYRASVCEAFAVAQARGLDANMAIDHAWTQEASGRALIAHKLSVDGIRRAPTESVTRYLSTVARSADTCAMRTVVDVLALWPEAEPDNLLLDVIDDNLMDGGSTSLAITAIDAAGETGRDDYVGPLNELVKVGNHPGVVWHAIRAQALITGRGDAALRVVCPGCDTPDEILFGLPFALRPAQSSDVIAVVEQLRQRDDPRGALIISALESLISSRP